MLFQSSLFLAGAANDGRGSSAGPGLVWVRVCSVHVATPRGTEVSHCNQSMGPEEVFNLSICQYYALVYALGYLNVCFYFQ